MPESIQSLNFDAPPGTGPAPHATALSDGPASYGALPGLLLSVAHATRAHPVERKLLVCGSPAEGRELLYALARSGMPWIGWEPVSLRQLALDLATPALAAERVGLADEFDVLRLLDEAVDETGRRGGEFVRAVTAPGFRAAAHRAALSLRAAGVGPDDVRAGAGEAGEALLAEVLAAYEAGLRAARLEDGAGVIRRAAELLESGATLPGDRIFVVPGLELTGAQGRLLRGLQERGGAVLLPADAVVGVEAPAGRLWRELPSSGGLSWLHAPGGLPAGLSAPAVRLFAGATPADELREVLRRVLERGIPWDEVEIVATDAFTYGPTLDSLARRLGIPVTHAAGLSSRRTRVGRAVAAYFEWVTDGFPAERLRALLESGDLEPPEEFETSGAALANRLRRLQVRWGRERYLPAIERALRALEEPAPAEDGRDPEEVAAERDRERRQLGALHAMLSHILAAVPPTPDRLRTFSVRTTPAALAGGLLAFLHWLPTAAEKVENTTRDEIRRRLDRARETLTRETGWDAAAAMLRTRLELQVAAQAGGGSAAWVSTGGALHLSDLRTGGLTNRRHTFVVGLDASRVASGGVTDPLLSDSVRRRLNSGAPGVGTLLPTSADRLALDRHALAGLLARLRGEVTLSYSAWDATEGRAVSPAAEMLQALRLRERNPELVYDDLRDALGPLACAVPHGESCLDASDVWMRALADGSVLRDGRDLVREAFPGLDRGLHARDRRAAPELTEYHGLVDAGAVRLLVEAMYFSPSSLETLGACPRRFFYRYLLRLRPSDAAEWDPEAWMDAGSRGSLLHAVYERTLREARGAGVPLSDAQALDALALGVLRHEAAEMRHHLPPPSERVFQGELATLQADVTVFAAMIAGAPPAWRELEWEFGGDGREVSVRADGVEVRLSGKIDRVDEVSPGVLRVIDYKSGSPRRYREAAPFDGGRRIQHWVYQLAAEQVLGARETSMEYHFPTVQGERRAVSYPQDRLRSGGEVLTSLVQLATAGRFVATDQAADCSYCDFASVCRAAKDDYGRTSCGATEWSARVGVKLPEFAPLTTLRTIDADDD